MTKIHQAIFGDKNGGYGLLAATCDAELAKKIASYTDVHEQTPDGVVWVNTLRGFPIEHYFLLMRTYVDLSADVRQGRVYSHCLIIPLNELEKFNDLRELLKYLPDNFKKDSAVEAFEISERGFCNIPSDLRTNCLIKALLHSDSDLFAWQDYNGYEEAICVIWNNVIPNIRTTLRFGMAFSVQESKGLSGVKVFSVPSKLIPKWKQHGLPVISSTDQIELSTLAEKSLGGSSSNDQLFEFVKEHGIQIKKIEDYLPIQKIMKTVAEIDSTDLNGQLTLLNTFSVYRSLSTSVNPLMEKIAKAIIKYIHSGSINEVIRVRIENLEQLLPSKLFYKVVSEIEARVASLSKNSSKNILDLFANLMNPSIQEWWKKTVTKGLKLFFEKSSEKAIRPILALIKKNNLSSIVLIDELLPVGCNEDLFIVYLKKDNNINYYASIEILARRRGWFVLLAIALAKTRNLSKALSDLISVDPEHICIAAYRTLVASFSFTQVLITAKNLRSSFITELVTDRLLEEPQNLPLMDVMGCYEQEVLAKLLDRGWDFFSYPKSKELLYDMLDALIDGSGRNEDLLLKISSNPKSEIFDYPRRVQAWEILPINIKNKLLANTAIFLLGQLSQNASVLLLDDTVLKEYITQTGISDFLYLNRHNIKNVIPVFKSFSLYDSQLEFYIAKYSDKIDVIDSKKLGELISVKTYKNSAYAIKRKASKDNNWRFALAECYYLLDIFSIGFLTTSGILSGVSISDDDWWQALEDLIVELYPNSLSLTTVWTNAGGKESDLIMNTNAHNVWHDLLHKLRHHAFKNITIDSLLSEINKRYDQNENFKFIYGLKANLTKSK